MNSESAEFQEGRLKIAGIQLMPKFEEKTRISREINTIIRKIPKGSMVKSIINSITPTSKKSVSST